MEQLAIHIYHLDDGEETDRVIKLLKLSGIGSQFSIERPTNETNAILVPIDLENEDMDLWQVRELKIRNAIALLTTLDKNYINSIKALGLGVAIRIHTTEYYLPLSDKFVTECGRLGIEICILNTTVAMDTG